MPSSVNKSSLLSVATLPVQRSSLFSHTVSQSSPRSPTKYRLLCSAPHLEGLRSVSLKSQEISYKYLREVEMDLKNLNFILNIILT